jgi:hypothetical protein
MEDEIKKLEEEVIKYQGGTTRNGKKNGENLRKQIHKIHF